MHPTPPPPINALVTALVLTVANRNQPTCQRLYKPVSKKRREQGFSKCFLVWVTNYLTSKRQFVQIDDKNSNRLNVNFGVLQGSILGPVRYLLFKISAVRGSVNTLQYQF